MRRVSHSAEICVPVEVCFDYVDDHSTVPKWMFGVTKFEPVGSRSHGLGTILDIAMKFGPMTVHATGEITEYAENERITVTLTEGPVDGGTTWCFSSNGSGGTVLSAEVAYSVSGGLTGKALAKAIDSLVLPTIEHSEDRLREQLDELYRS